jgi:hypothetical protein
MCDRGLREGISNENEGEHTLADAVTCITGHARGATMPSPVGQSQL